MQTFLNGLRVCRHLPLTHCRVAKVGLGNIGAPARQALPALIEASKANDFHVRQSSANAILAIAPEMASIAVPVLVNGLKSAGQASPFGYSLAVLETLERMATIPKEAKPLLVELQGDSNSAIGERAANCLKKIESDTSARTGVK